MSNQTKKVLNFKGKLGYLRSKTAKKNKDVSISFKNGLKFIVRAKTMDKSVLKEVWIKNIYDKYQIKVEKGDTVIDIGAHIGVFSIYACELSETGKVYAFEPFIENFKRLENHKNINHKENLAIYNLGVSSITGVQTLHLSPDNNTGGHSLHLKTESDKTIDIETIRLNDFCEKENITQIDFLKLDCEGAEYEILLSDESILNKVKKIIMECHPHKDHTVDEMMSLLKKNQFNVFCDKNNDDTGIAMIYGIKN